jgi:hypothetical protein
MGGTLLLSRDADDGGALWNGRRDRAEAITAELKGGLALALPLRLSADKTLLPPRDAGCDCWGYRLAGGQRGADGPWGLVSRVPPKAIRRVRDAVQNLTSHPFTAAVAAWTALAGWLRGWGHDAAEAADSRRMDSWDAVVHREVWKACLATTDGREKRAYAQYPVPRSVRETGCFPLGGVAGEQIVRLPRLSSLPRTALPLSYPPAAFLVKGRV